MSRRKPRPNTAGGVHEACETPGWVVDQAYDRIFAAMPGGRWLEPGAGRGNIIRAINRHRSDVEWTAAEIREECRAPLEETGALVAIGDFLKMETSSTFDVCAGNPPFSLAESFVEKARSMARQTVLLVKVALLEGGKRQAWLDRIGQPEEIHVLPHRPAFVGGHSDSCVYAWMTWWSHIPHAYARTFRLPVWPEAARGVRPRSKPIDLGTVRVGPELSLDAIARADVEPFTGGSCSSVGLAAGAAE